MNRGGVRRGAAWVLGAGLLAGGLIGIPDATAQGRGPGGPGPHGGPGGHGHRGVAPLTRGPVSYFMASCASCHGADGRNLSPTFGSSLSDAQRRAKVKEMADGMASAPISGPHLEAATALTRTLGKNEPFVAWTGQSGPLLMGELTQGTKLSVLANGKPLTPTVKGIKWTVRLPAGVTPDRVVLVASRGTVRHQVALREGAFSFHARRGPGGPGGSGGPRRGR